MENRKGKFGREIGKIEYMRYNVIFGTYFILSEEEEVVLDKVYNTCINESEYLKNIIGKSPKTKDGNIDRRFLTWHEVLVRINDDRILVAYIGLIRNYLIIGVLNNPKNKKKQRV